jgi:hypothetical protein
MDSFGRGIPRSSCEAVEAPFSVRALTRVRWNLLRRVLYPYHMGGLKIAKQRGRTEDGS